jgi:transposase
MQVVVERCCGLDVHKRVIVACVLSQRERMIRSFGTMTDDLEALADWLEACGVSHVAMESTGIFWKPVHNVLEGRRFVLLVVNAQHMKAIPGKKTDVKDAEWIADLLRHGLLKASFVPTRAERELRELVRYRKTLIRERAAESNRIQKMLEGANIKLASVATHILGRSGRAMVEALVAGVSDPAQLADLAQGKLRLKRVDLERALHGVVGPHQRLILASQLRHIHCLDAELEQLSRDIAERLRQHEEALTRLESIPGVGRRTAEVILTEVGADLSRFPTAGHLASWAGLCPGQNESAGKQRSSRTRKGSAALREALTEAARAAGRTRHCYLAAQYRRIAARRGANRAAVAVAHTILVIAYHLLTKADVYQDLGANYFDEQDKDATVKRAVARIRRLGYEVTLAPNAAA